MKELNRQVQKQIEEATRENKGRVKIIDQANLVSFGEPNLSDQPNVPTVLWRVTKYSLPADFRPSTADIIDSLNGRISVAKTIYSLPGNLNGGFSDFLAGVITTAHVKIHSTRIKASSTRNVKTSLVASLVARSNTNSYAIMAPMIRSENADGSANLNGLYPDWTRLTLSAIAYSSSHRVDLPIEFRLNGDEWVSLALYSYAGSQTSININSAYSEIVFSLDASEFITDTPPSPPSWGTPAIQTDYIDESVGSSKNILNIKTPTEGDWLGVGIYRASAEPTSDLRNGRDVIRATGSGNTDLGRNYYWSHNGKTIERYIFSSENIYQKNLIPNSGFLYDTNGWTLTAPAGAANNLKLVKLNPWTAPHCLKASADYSGAARFNVIAKTSVVQVDSTRPYKLVWYMKAESTTPGYTQHSSKPMSAIQINYYRNATPTLLTSTPYQIKRYRFTEPQWTRYEETIYPLRYWSSANPSGLTGASAISQFAMPSYCTHLDISFKMWNNHSARSILYFDGVDLEVDSGQPVIYNRATVTGVTLNPAYKLTSEESTAYGIFRIPFRGSVTEVYAAHTTAAIGDNFYLSSAHWTKFGQGIDLGIAAVNRIKNGNFLNWVAAPGGGQVPQYWAKYGGNTRIQTYRVSTSIYGGGAGIYWTKDNIPGVSGSGIQYNWAATAQANVTASFWLKLDTGAVRIGDLYTHARLAYKEPGMWWFSNKLLGKKDGPPHQDYSERVVSKNWEYHTIHLATSYVFNIASDIPGTRCYFDGFQINQNRQADGTTRNFPTIFDPKRYFAGATPKPTSYVLCSTNSLTPNVWTIRCVYHPAYPWYLKSTVTGRYEVPRPTIWSFGDNDTGPTPIKSWLSYIPFRNTDSSGGYFQWYGNNFSQRMIIAGPRTEFKPFDPIHLVAVFYKNEGAREFGKYTKLYVNGVGVGSQRGQDIYGVGAWLPTFNAVPQGDNLVIGAKKGSLTTTAIAFAGYDVSTTYGHANGIISEFRVDNYAWDETQVTDDLNAQRARYGPNAALTNLVYTHLADHIKDGSEKQTFQYEDIGVKAGKYYAYALDAYDYLNNRSPLGATAGVVAGDNIAPTGAYTSTGYSVNKGTHLTFYWRNPSDADFSRTRIFEADPTYKHLDYVYGSPGGRSYWSAGFVGYGARKRIRIRAIDKRGNEQFSPAYEQFIEGWTKKGPLKRIDGNIFTNIGYGLQNGREVTHRANALTWGNTYVTTENPRSPNYRDFYAYISVENSAYPNVIKVPVKMGSVTGLEYNTAYHLYLVDSSNGRTNALRMGWALTLATADSNTAYPLGTYFTGNTTVKGYFVPNDSVGMSPSQTTMVAGRIESPDRDTYFDLQNSKLHNEDDSGNYTEMRAGGIYYYDSATQKTFTYPKIMSVIPPGLINVGFANTYASWGLRPFSNTPDILLVPANVKTYSTAGGFGKSNHTSQSLFIGFDVVNHTQCTPVVKIFTSKQTQTNTTFSPSERQVFAQDTGQPYGYPVIWDQVYQIRSGISTATAWDTATGGTTGGFTGIGPNNSTAIARIEIEISFYSSAQPRTGGRHLKMKWMTHYCSAYGYAEPSFSNYQYNDHGAPSPTVSAAHKVWYNDASNSIIVSTQEKRTKWTKVITRDFLNPAPYKPLVTWAFASAQPKLYGAQPASDIVWTSNLFASSGATWIGDMKIERVTYYTKDGLSESQTGYGLLSALVIDRG